MRRPPTLTGDVIARSNPAYPAARQESNRHLSFFPRFVVFCESDADVRTAIRWSQDHCLPFRVRCGRHSYQEYSVLNGGMVIDISRLNSVELDARRGIARIGAGANLGHIYDELWNQGRVTIPGGGCTGVGISGLTLGGGFGLLTRLWGLTCDSMLQLEMVDANAHMATASAEENRDLFWASKGGGGGNFGLVTAFTFAVQPIDYVTVFSVTWKWSDIRRVFAAWQRWADPESLDRRLVPILTLPAASAGTMGLIGEFVGPCAALDRLIQPMLAAAEPTDLMIKYETYIEAVHRFTGSAPTSASPEQIRETRRWAADTIGDPALDKFKNTSAFVFRPLPPEAVAIMIDQLRCSPSPNTLVQFNLHGGAEADIPNFATAYPWRRGVWYSLQYQSYWSDPAEGPALVRWVEGFRRRMLPWTRGAYVNYIDADIPNWPQEFYDGNLRRLLDVKHQIDPRNVFDFPQGLGRVRL